MSLNMLLITLLLVCIGVHTCVFICASTCKCVSIYGGQREPPWVLFFGNNSSHFWIILDIVTHWFGACQVGSLDWLANNQLSTCLHLPSARSISTCCHTWVLCWLVGWGFDKASEDWNQVPTFARKHFPGPAVCPVLVLLFCILNISSWVHPNLVF